MNSPWNSSNILDDIIINIPVFVNRTVFNQINKVLAFYGNYHVDKFYNINDFIINKENFIFKVKVELNSNLIEQNEEINEKVNKSRFNSNVFNNNDLNNNAKHFVVISELNLILLEINSELKAICKLILSTSLNDITLMKIKSSLNTVPKIGILLHSFEYLKYLEITLFDSVKENFFSSLIEKRQDGLKKDFNLIYDDLYFKRDQRIYSNNIYSSVYFQNEVNKNHNNIINNMQEKNNEKYKLNSFNDKSITLKDFVEDKEYNKILEDSKPKNKLKFSNKKSNSNVNEIEKLDKENEVYADFFLLKENNMSEKEKTNSKLITEESNNQNIQNNQNNSFIDSSNFTCFKSPNNDFSIKKYFKLNKSQVMNCYFINYPIELIKLRGILKIKKDIFKNLFDQDGIFAKPNSDLISKEIIYIYQILIEAFSFLDKGLDLKDHLQEMNEFIYSFKLNK